MDETSVTGPTHLWTPQELANYLGVPVKTVYGWNHVRSGPPRVRVGRYVRYRPDDIARWLDARRVA